MITTGVDLAAQPARTALAVIAWRGDHAELEHLQLGADDDTIVRLSRDSARVGVDCAFGWPDEFVAYVTANARGDAPHPDHRGLDGRRRLAYRDTDRAVQTLTGRLPLSVSTDRLGLTAMRCADLLAAFGAAGDTVDRSGLTGHLVEVYPAASLRLWGVDVTGYKTDAAARVRATANLLDHAGWLRVDTAQRALMEASDDALDAAVAACVARAHAVGATHPIPEDARARARREGWIALPDGPLARLV
ncbi:DUF429 domain-containing protein [Microbacterium sp. EYE_5]|uniref:DUF429 domain-containing protein n=1 Tax=unclassified Microbacterium TaxID=2609290 RepID=UPI002005A0BE|nr:MULTISPECIES: DUF429 domain-containing protein [unclassified Microbacterium]MCK6079817.1 DUF429 domain-containing protein [Microbacterium sp. EYE_382]MCK6085088.1 DUF429 domain-containing protein [Microbacterium sp. EYE_384]MCK6122686.1 DUF429 domain-containing protein [Microbacterium sp. EYE_80]MCK6125851.1 DUF429 domain-containing protein [Microbacterium sp. EYE_79]MCK6140772.1 DUF429 domain-containing protein [Microbacterium sp. EYE_39]